MVEKRERQCACNDQVEHDHAQQQTHAKCMGHLIFGDAAIGQRVVVVDISVQIVDQRF
jgi:hypothetical protein